ncbi:MAG TPA: autotransporter assembly complex family protein [Ensifer sp.]|nr:autotransporter assembly complex family protein [Ensifer sp.]
MSEAYRQWGSAAVAAVAALSFAVAPPKAEAFDIFGIHLFGAEEKDQQIADPVRYSATLTVNDPDLQKALNDQSALMQDQSKPVDGDFGLVVKAKDDRDRLVALLYERARYGAVVTVRVNGIEVDKLPALPSFARFKPVPVTISVTVGPVFTLGRVVLKDDAGKLDPSNYGLVAGGNAGSQAILDASTKIVRDLKAEGRPLARVSERTVVADHATNRVDVTLAVQAGPVAPLGEVTVNGASQVNPGFVSEWSDLRTGEDYSPDRLKRAAKRLRELGTFSTVAVTEGKELAPDGTIPIKIDVTEGKQRYFGAGIQYSTIDGVGLQGYWGHRNLFGNAESLKISGSVNRLGQTRDFKKLDYSANVAFAKPGAFGPATTFTANFTAGLTHTASYDAKVLSGAVGVTYDLTDQDKLSAGLALDWTKAQDVYGDNRYLTASVPLGWTRDTTDDKFDPTSGFRASLTLRPSFGVYNKTPFVSAEGSISAYRQVGDSGPVLAGKVAVGTLVGARDLADIPATRRFYAGGGGSVRGYAYQGISPRDAANNALGGRSYVTASIEARFKVTDTIGVVPFLDFGTVSSRSAPSFSDIRAGAGVGLRYATPFGPIRLDVAVPLRRYPGGSTFGIYAGIGQAF